MGKPSNSHRALLGMLTLGPASGYDLNKRLESSLSHFWRESYGQIYPALRQLQAEGLIDGHQEAQVGRPARTVYQLTPQGHAAFVAWLREPVAVRPPRNELLLRLFFGHQLPPQELWGHLQAYVERQRGLLETYRQLEGWLEQAHAGKPELPYWLSTLTFGRSEAEVHLRWAEETAQTLGLPQEERNA